MDSPKILSPHDEELLSCGLRATVTKVSHQIWQSGECYLGYTNRPRPDCGLVFVCSDMEMHYSHAGGVFIARRGDAVYIPAGLQYRVSFQKSTPESRLDSYTVNFHLFDRDSAPILLSDDILLLSNDPQNRRYAPLCAELYEAFCLERIGRSRNALKQEAVFLYLFDRVLTDARSQNDIHYPIRRGVRALTEEWDRNEPIGKYAALSNLSESYFYLLFKRSMGVSPVEYRNLIRIHTACSLLEGTSMSIEEIAASVGFDSPFYLSRIFKKHIHLSPRQYRQEHQK